MLADVSQRCVCDYTFIIGHELTGHRTARKMHGVKSQHCRTKILHILVKILLHFPGTYRPPFEDT